MLHNDEFMRKYETYFGDKFQRVSDSYFEINGKTRYCEHGLDYFIYEIALQIARMVKENPDDIFVKDLVCNLQRINDEE